MWFLNESPAYPESAGSSGAYITPQEFAFGLWLSDSCSWSLKALKKEQNREVALGSPVVEVEHQEYLYVAVQRNIFVYNYPWTSWTV